MSEEPAARGAGHILVRGVSMGADVVGSGPVLLLVHGFPLNRSMWRPVTAALSGYRCIAPDLRGFGTTAPPPRGWSMAGYADDLAALLDGFQTEAAVVCGLSMGGYVAFEFWRRHPQRIRGLILANTRAAADSVEARAQRDQMIALVRQRGCGLLADRLLTQLLAPGTLQEAGGVVAEIRAMIAGCRPEGVIGALRAMKTRADSRPLLSSIAVPTLVIAGAEDRLVPSEEAEAMAAAIPGSRCLLIPQAGHLAPLEQPKPVVEAIAALSATCP